MRQAYHPLSLRERVRVRGSFAFFQCRVRASTLDVEYSMFMIPVSFIISTYNRQDVLLLNTKRRIKSCGLPKNPDFEIHS